MTEALLIADPLLHLAAAACYMVVFVLLVVEMLLGRRTASAAMALAWVGTSTHALGILARWTVAGHGPMLTKYENLSAYAFVTAGLALYLGVRKAGLRSLGVLLYPAAFLMIGVAVYTGPDLVNLPPAFTGVWLVMHVCFYFLAFGSAMTAVSASVLLMVRSRLRPTVAARLPDVDDLDVAAYRFAGLAFTFWGIGMLTGSIWAYNAWGRYWGWDPVETWSLVTWLILGVYLHLRRFFGWDGTRAAWLIVLSFALALMSLFGTTFITGSLHGVYFR
ncbi:MAG: cytochrome c biogenesis protein CcsA [Anaerosomatales bacterium]|nr:cytochrome c biogenesis protein CcsA [Anaerosomatales bacterium]